MRARRRALATAALLSVLTTPLSAFAAGDEKDGEPPAPETRALAEALFREGKALGEGGNIAAACTKFAESQRLDPALGTLLHLAACYETEGKTASAWAAFGAARELAERAKQGKRAELARQRAAELEKKLSRIVITAAEPVQGMSIEIDGRVLSDATLSTPLPVDPGRRVVSVTAPGKQRWTTELDVVEGPSTVAVEVPVLEAATVEPPPSSEPAAPLPPPVAPSEPPPNTARIAGLVMGGVGLAAIAVGGYFGLRAASQAEDADRHCDGSLCTQEGLDGHEAARASALIANIGFGVGVGALAGGAYLFFTSGSAAAEHGSAKASNLHVAVGGVW